MICDKAQGAHQSPLLNLGNGKGSVIASKQIIKSIAGMLLPIADRVLYGESRAVVPKLEGAYLVFDYDIAPGFVIMNRAIYEGFKRANPTSEVIVACGPLTFDALSANPYVDGLINVGDPIESISSPLLRFLTWRFSKGARPDIALINCSMEKLRTDILVLVSGPACRIGTGQLPIYDLITESTTTTDPSDRGVLENTLSRLTSVGIRNPVGGPRIYFNTTDFRNSRELLTSGLESRAIRVAYATRTSGGHPNQWWDGRLAEVAGAVASLTGAPAIFLGVKGHVAPIEGIRCQTKSVSFAGKTNLRKLAALIAQCDLLVSLDTGTLHVGRGTGNPTVVIREFGVNVRTRDVRVANSLSDHAPAIY